MSKYSLGQMYESGLGVAPDEIEAYKWFHLAAGHGLADAEKAGDQLRRSLTPEQIAEGQRGAVAFVPKKSLGDHH